MNEHELERLAKGLGKRGDAVDPERMAESVVKVLSTPLASDAGPWWRRMRVLQAAAAVIVLAVGSTVVFGNGATDEIWDVAPLEVELLSSDELDEVLDSLSWDTPASEVVSLGFYDLGEEELLQLLEAMEG